MVCLSGILKPTDFLKAIAKVGTIREWKAGRFRKVGPGLWKKVGAPRQVREKVIAGMKRRKEPIPAGERFDYKKDDSTYRRMSKEVRSAKAKLSRLNKFLKESQSRLRQVEANRDKLGELYRSAREQYKGEVRSLETRIEAVKSDYDEIRVKQTAYEYLLKEVSREVKTKSQYEAFKNLPLEEKLKWKVAADQRILKRLESSKADPEVAAYIRNTIKRQSRLVTKLPKGSLSISGGTKPNPQGMGVKRARAEGKDLTKISPDKKNEFVTLLSNSFSEEALSSKVENLQTTIQGRQRNMDQQGKKWRGGEDTMMNNLMVSLEVHQMALEEKRSQSISKPAPQKRKKVVVKTPTEMKKKEPMKTVVYDMVRRTPEKKEPVKTKKEQFKAEVKEKSKSYDKQIREAKKKINSLQTKLTALQKNPPDLRQVDDFEYRMRIKKLKQRIAFQKRVIENNRAHKSAMQKETVKKYETPSSADKRAFIEETKTRLSRLETSIKAKQTLLNKTDKESPRYVAYSEDLKRLTESKKRQEGYLSQLGVVNNLSESKKEKSKEVTLQEGRIRNDKQKIRDLEKELSGIEANKSEYASEERYNRIVNEQKRKISFYEDRVKLNQKQLNEMGE